MFRRAVRFQALIFCLLFLIHPIYYCSAREFEEGVNYEQLIEESEQILRSRPNDKNLKKRLSILYHNRAMELVQRNEWVEAIEKARRAVELAPGQEIIKRNLSVIYNNYSLTLRQEGKFKEALKNLELALEYAQDKTQIEKNIATVYLDLANNAYQKGEYINCSRYLSQSVKFDRDNPYAYALSGEVAYKADNYYQAYCDWSQAVKLNPQLSDIEYKLERLKKEKELERDFKLRDIGKFRLKFEGYDNEDLARQAAQILNQAYLDIGQDFNIYPNTTISVIIYPASKLKQTDYFPEWAMGGYDGKIRFNEDIGKSQLQMKQLLYHEYTHALVFILAGRNVPLWLNEGLAEYEANRFKKVIIRKARKKLLWKSVRNEEVFSLSELSGLDPHKIKDLSQEKIELFYTQSESFVTYLIKRYSLSYIRNLLVRLGEKDEIHSAIKDLFYTDLDVLERNWKDTLKGND